MYRTPRTMRSARFGFREEPEKKDEHRGSRMPSHMASIDPLFHAAASRDFEPETQEQRAAFQEKAEAIWTIANGMRR